VGFEGRVGFGPMLEAALREGHEIKIRSGFRPHVSQATIFRSWVRQQRSLGFAQDEAERRAAASSAHAGHSEHQLGTTADLVSREPRGTFYEGWDPQRIAASAPMRWVHDNARRFGLVISYDRGSSDITQYVWEPWHLRFVGVAVADELHRRGMPLEAWMQERYGAEPPPPYTLPARGEEP
jgi:D-alanyl-D-alanine carboxypeptidase